jgi:WD repeat-containing protein 23
MLVGTPMLLSLLVSSSAFCLDALANSTAASAWNGYNMARGTCTLHSFNENIDDEGDPPMGHSVNNVLKEEPELYQNSTYGMD